MQMHGLWSWILTHRYLESLADADLAFGCETQALVAAIACDITAISTLPPTEPPSLAIASCYISHA